MPGQPSSRFGSDRPAETPAPEAPQLDTAPPNVLPYVLPGEANPPRFGEGAVSGATLVIAAKLAGFAISLVAVAVIARRVTPQDYGLVTMVLSVTAILAVPSDFGLSYVTIQRPQITQQQLSTLFWINVGFGVLLGLLTVALAPGLVWFYNDGRLLWIAFAQAALFPLAALGVQHEALVRRNLKFRRLFVIRLVGTSSGALVGILTACAGWGYWALVSQSLALALGGSLAAWFAIRWRPGRPRRCEDLRSMLTFGGRLTLHGIFGYFSNNADKVLLGKFRGAIDLGLYSQAYTLMMKVIQVAGYSVGDAAIPVLSRSAADAQKSRATFRRMFQLTCLIGLPAAAAGALWAGDIVLTVLGRQWVAAAVVLQLLFLGVIPRMLSAATGWVYIAGGRPDRMLRWQVFWSALAVASFAAGLPWGAIGIASAYALANWLSLAPSFTYCFRPTHFRWQDAAVPALVPALCTLAAGAAGALGQRFLAPAAAPGLVRLSVELSLFVAVYGILTATTVPLAKELLGKAWGLLRPLTATPAVVPTPRE
jgi:PST family polysaccharide transporter